MIMDATPTKDVTTLLASYPKKARQRLLSLRGLILDCANENPEIGTINETLKWGEPSYLCKDGSTLRIDWKEKSPQQYAMYFHCQSRLVETFKELYGDAFHYEGNRAIVFQLDEPIPDEKLKHCILLSLTYHKRKHLPLLGA